MSKEDLAWAAGLFEGEGCFSASTQTHSGGQWTYPRASLETTDLDVLEKFVKIIGIGKIRLVKSKSRPKHWKPIYVWCVYGHNSVQEVSLKIGPFLGVRRTERMNEILSIPRRSKKSKDPV